MDRRRSNPESAEFFGSATAIGGPFRHGARALLPCLALLALVPALAGSRPAPAAPKVVIETDHGAFSVELYPRWAPQAVSRFLARGGLGPPPPGTPEAAPYAGSMLCEERAHGFLVFGCLPWSPGDVTPPRAPGREPRQDDEIDGKAMGLAGQRISNPVEEGWLWQREVFPRYLRLHDEGKTIPAGLESLVDAVRRRGIAATSVLDGMSRLAYLEALGYRFERGGSPLRVLKGCLATANFWPGEADERFLLALADLPERDGRATVFGRVVAGWETLDAMEKIPVDKSHRPRASVSIKAMHWADSTTEVAPAPDEESSR